VLCQGAFHAITTPKFSKYITPYAKEFEVLCQPIIKSETKIKVCQLSNIADTHI
jgi:predicted glycoside hydrolase/deacetylase ChbG (UPF0249 family)